MKKRNFVGLIIMDGLGLTGASSTNAVSLAKKPFLDSLWKNYPTAALHTSGEAVGLPEGQMGNSEVGHLNLGAGRVVYQSLTRINKSISDGDFYTNKAFLHAIRNAKKHNKKLHILGLAGSGGVHSSNRHIIALIELAKMEGHDQKTFLHLFTDGRDTGPETGYEFVKEIIDAGGNVASISGRYFGMDRDNNWERIQKSFDIMTIKANNPLDALLGIKNSYANGVFDEFIIPFQSNPAGIIENGDSAIFANFRPDRAIRIATALSNPSHVSSYQTTGKPVLDYSRGPKNIFFVSMGLYSETVLGEIAFPLVTLYNLYGDVIAAASLKQFRCAETEKYPHVTFFFDGGIDKVIPGSERFLVESPKVATYDLKPEMSAYEVRDKAIQAIKTKEFATMILNFANPDMVGHTGNIAATTKSVEVIDACVKDVVKAIEEIGGVAIILADHGNAEVMRTPPGDLNGNVHTAHTTNLVPITITDETIEIRDGGSLSDIAPTMLAILGIQKPKEMTGKSLIK